MQRYRYIITDIDSGNARQCTHEPEGWDSYGVTFGRETGISNVVKGYVSSWTFVKEDARWLRDMLLQHGPNRRLRLRVLDDATSLRTTSAIVYEGDIDLTQAEWTDVTFIAPTGEGGFFKALENKWDEKYEVPFDSYIKIDGATMGDESPLQGISHISGRYNPLKSNHICFIPKMQFTKETELNEEFLNNTEMVQLNFNIPNSMILNYTTGDPRTRIGKDMSFFHCGVEVIKKLKLSYDISATCSIAGLALSNSNNQQFRCFHRLSIYGVPTYRLDNDITTYLVYELNSMDSTVQNDYDRRYYKELSVSRETVTVKKDSDKRLYANYNARFTGDFEIDEFDTKNSQGMSFFLVVEFDCGSLMSNGVITGNIYEYMDQGSEIDMYIGNNTCNVEYVMQINQHKHIAAVKSVDVFRMVIDNINDGMYQVNVDTAAFEEVSKGDFLTSGEGMRNKPRLPYRSFTMHGSLSTSLSDFLMYAYAVYGFRFGVNVSSGVYTVFLAHQPFLYEQTSVIGRIQDTAEMSFSIAREMLYSSIRVGYKTDSDIFDAVNEYNNEQVWSTPNTEIEGNELEIISPYSASSKAVETFIFKNWSQWGDSSREEKDIYLINAVYSKEYAPKYPEITGPEYELERSITVLSGVDYPDTQWNLKYTPKRMLKAHEVELNSMLAFEVGKQIELVTCDFNSSLVSYKVNQIGQNKTGIIKESEDITIGSDRVFVPVIVTFNAIAGSKWIKMVEANRLGVVEVKRCNKTIRGFIADGESSITINPIEESQGKYKLLLERI